MNYRHAFHAGNHADALKHMVLLALCESLVAKPAACFALDTHAGRGLYRLEGEDALRTGEASGGVARLRRGIDRAIDRYLDAIDACREQHGADAYPGSPWLLAHALRAQDRIACCELRAGEAAALKANFAGDARVAVHACDGYGAIKALLPPKVDGERFARGLVLIDPPYEAQLAEFDAAFSALREGLSRWPQAAFALWYPLKQRRALQPMLRKAAALPAKSALLVELLVRPDDSPLRMNGSGLLLLNSPFGIGERLSPAVSALRRLLEEGEGRGDARLEWLRAPA